MRAGFARFVPIAALLLLPATARATWSIAAVDPETQEVGVAVASCVEAPFGSTILPFVAGLAPGIGALAAQALYEQSLRDQALDLLLSGASPQDVIDGVTAIDGQAQVRQYGVVTLDRSTAAFTGTNTFDWAGDAQSPGVTVQGNILVGPEVVADALAAFEAEAPGCPFTLADRLMLALEAGAAQGGDNRCSTEQTALAAALRVALPGDDPDAPTLDLRIPSQPDGGDNPVVLLRAAYDRWRRLNPPDDSMCSEGTGTSTGGGSSEGDSNGGAADTAGTAGMADTAGSTPDGSGSGSPSETQGQGSGAASSSTGAAPNADSHSEGCGCRSERWGRGSGLVLSLLMVGLAGAWIRRRVR